MTKTYEVKDEDGEVLGQVRRIHNAELGWVWRSWTIRDDARGYSENKLSLHDTPDEAESEINEYWGILK